MLKMLLTAGCLALGLVQAAAAQNAVPGPSNFNVDKVLEAAARPKPGLVLLSAHRGVWENVPENSRPAIAEALKQNIETVEIDVRLSANQMPWLLHDYAMDRLTTGHGYLSAYADRDLQSVFLRNRYGETTGSSLLKFEDALRILGDNLTVKGADLRGFVLVVDLKNPPGNDINAKRSSAYIALKQCWAILKRVSAEYPRLKRARFKGPALGQAVIFKLRAAELPAPPDLERAIGAGDLDTFHVVPVLHPDDKRRDSGNRVLRQYLDKPYAAGFEIAIEYIGQPNAKRWMEFLQGLGRTTSAFPSWNEFPEGVANSNGLCCLKRNTDPDYPRRLDYGGSFDFTLQIGGDWLTSDMAPYLDSYLRSIGRRDLRQIQ